MFHHPFIQTTPCFSYFQFALWVLNSSNIIIWLPNFVCLIVTTSFLMHFVHLLVKPYHDSSKFFLHLWWNCSLQYSRLDIAKQSNTHIWSYAHFWSFNALLRFWKASVIIPVCLWIYSCFSIIYMILHRQLNSYICLILTSMICNSPLGMSLLLTTKHCPFIVHG